MATPEIAPREIKPFAEITSPLDHLLIEHVVEFCATQAPTIRVPGVIFNTLVDDRNTTPPVLSFRVGCNSSTGKLYRKDKVLREPTPLEGVEIVPRATLGFPETKYGKPATSRTTMCARFAIVAGSIPNAVETNGLTRYISHFGGYRGIAALSEALQTQFQ